MKTASYVLGGVLAFVVCFESRALPPRQHTVSGQIKAIDREAHTITLASSKTGKVLLSFGGIRLGFRKGTSGSASARWKRARPSSFTTGTKSDNSFSAKSACLKKHQRSALLQAAVNGLADTLMHPSLTEAQIQG